MVAFEPGDIIYRILMILVSALILFLTVKYIFKVKKKKDYLTALLYAAVIEVIVFVLFLFKTTTAYYINYALMLIVGWPLIKQLYKQKWNWSLYIWLAWFVLSMVVRYILTLIGISM
ncbi:hypothetical protein KY330_05505 [Candidatus Woesearchaeota archaeon]|nr:hypothetical protein [Candidatus Woesearchaeota archaeon]